MTAGRTIARRRSASVVPATISEWTGNHGSVTENTTLTLDNLRAMDAPAEFLVKSEEALAARDREVILFLVTCLVGLVLAITVLGIYVTHKVAGPIYVLAHSLPGREPAGKSPAVAFAAMPGGEDLAAVSNQ